MSRPTKQYHKGVHVREMFKSEFNGIFKKQLNKCFKFQWELNK